MRGCSTSLVSREMQVKTTWGISSKLSEWLSSKNTNNKYWRWCGEKGTFLHCWWECKLGWPLWRTVWRLLKKLKIELSHNLAILLLGMYVKKKKNKTSDSKWSTYLGVHYSIIYNNQDTEATQVSINQWMAKESMVYIDNRILSDKQILLSGV